MGRKKTEFTKEQDARIAQLVNDGYSLSGILSVVNKEFDANFSRSGIDRRIKSLGIERTINRTETTLCPRIADKVEELREWKRKQWKSDTITEQNICSHDIESEFNPLVIGITYENRELLYERINKRVEIMLENGLLKEAESTYSPNGTKGAFQAIGHKEIYPFINGEMTLEEAKENLCRQTRRYAKRQLTWFRRDERINWIYADLCDNATAMAIKLAEDFLERGDN